MSDRYMYQGKTACGSTAVSQIEQTLAGKFANRPLSDLGANEPVCRRCLLDGTESETLQFDDGDVVYIQTCWEPLGEWTLYGLYHAEHADVGTSDRIPPKPIATLSGCVHRTTDTHSGTGYLTLTDITLMDMSVPAELSDVLERAET